MAVNEITEVVLKSRLRTVLRAHLPLANDNELSDAVLQAYESAAFHEFVGVVGKATEVERIRASQTARRLGHGMTANIIAQGK